MENTNWNRLTGLFFPSLVTMSLVVSVVAFGALGPVAGIKSGYVLIGLLFAVTVYSVTNTGTEGILDGTYIESDRHLYEIVLGLVGGAVVAVAGARALGGVSPSLLRMGVLVIVLPVGYLLLTLQIQRGVANRRLLLQILCLYALDPLTKYLSTNFYFGRGDIPKHVYFSELVATTGSWQAIPETTFYSHFPGLQTLVGSVSVLTGLSPYDSLVITGIVTYIAVVCVAYLLAELVFSDRLFPIYVALSVTMLAPIHRYSVYFYPQALATALVLIVVLAGCRYSAVQSSNYVTHLLLSLPLVVALWFSHHFTVVLFLPILVGLVVGPPLVRAVFGFTDTVRPQALPLVALVGGSLAYWLLADIFISTLREDLSKVLGFAAVASDTTGGSEVVGLGTAIPEPSVRDAVLSLFSVGGLYNIMLICIFSLGALMIFRDLSRYRKAGGIVGVGVCGAALMIRTPIDIHGLVRTQLPLSVFVAFVVAAGLNRLFPVPKGSLKKLGTTVFVVGLLTTTGPAVVADDMYRLHSGPDLWESRTVPETQKEFTAAEMASFERSAAFSDRQDVSVGTDWNSQLGLNRYGRESESFDVRDDQIRTDQELLLYRNRWLDHSIRLVPERLSFVTLLVSSDWRDRMVASENKVYTTGEVGMLADNRNASYVTEE